jgi:hypothetical protein
MEIVIRGHNLPGRDFRNVGVPIHNVHVGLQVRDAPEGLVRADAASAEWRAEVRIVESGGAPDFKGPAVHGRKGERHLYLSWGDVGDRTFAMFRRAKLMLGAIDPALIALAQRDGRPLVATIDLTDGYGGPRSARVDPPAIVWALGDR